jgi:hypothetical protein
MVIGKTRTMSSSGMLLCLLGAILLASAPPTTHAQNAAITWQVTPGFDGTLKAGMWFPLTVTISNAGPDVRGTLSFRLRTGQATTYSQTIDLPLNANKKIVMPVAADNAGDGVTQGDLTLLDGDRVVKSQRINVNVLGNGQLAIGVLSDDASALPELSNIRDPNRFGTSLLRIGVDQLPDRGELWGTLDTLFVHNIDTSALSEAQREAMRAWINNGGHLVAGGDARVVSGLADLLPANAAERDATGTLAALGEGTGWDVQNPDLQVPLLTLAPKPGAEVVRANGDLPLLLRQPYGNGSITQAAFDLATLRDVGAPDQFWPRVLPIQMQISIPQQLRDQGFWTLQQSLNLPALRLPSILGFLGFLVLYIAVVGPLNYLLLRRLDRREWAYLTIPLLVLLFSGGAYVWGTAGRGQSAIVSELSVVRAAQGMDEGQATTYLALFSPSRSTYDLRLQPDALVTNLEPQWQRQGQGLDVLYAEDAVRFPDLLVDVGGVRAFAIEQTVAMPTVEATLRTVDGEPQITIRNRSDQPIGDVLLVRGDGRAQEIDDLAAGAEQTIAFDPNRWLQDMFNVDDSGVINRRAVLSQLSNVLTPGMMFNGGPVAVPVEPAVTVDPVDPRNALPDPNASFTVLGWQPQPVTQPTLDGGDAEVVGETLYLWSVAKEQ